MRILTSIVLSVMMLSGLAWAQGYEYRLSGLEFESTAPAVAGQSVQGLVRTANGFTALGNVYVEGLYYGDLFVYWEGYFNGEYYYYDVYSGYWRPGPVGVDYATLSFQGEILEGYVRTFGDRVDQNHFFGRDGILYKRVNIERNRRRSTNRRAQVVYTYFVNMANGERSDGEGQSYIVIGDSSVVVQVEKQAEEAQVLLDELVATDPAYPLWQETAQEVPTELVTPTDLADVDESSLLELIEGEIGPLVVGSEEGAE